MSDALSGKTTVELDSILIALINAQEDARKALKMNVEFLTARVQALHNENEQLRATLTQAQSASADNMDL